MKKTLKGIYLFLIVLFLYLPIFTLMVLSFNGGKTMNAWVGFSLEWYEEMFSNRQIMEALGNTLTIAFWAAAISTVIGVMACIGINAMREKSKTILMGINNIPLLNADIVTGISLMLSFLMFGISLNYGTVLIAHVTFCIPYVILSVMPKFKQLENNTYEAALDLGATPAYALFKVIIPQIASGILSGFVMAVTLSLDDYFVATYTKPATFDTISTYVVNATKGSQTQIKTALWALSTIIFIIVIVVELFINIVPSRKEKKEG